MFDHPDIASSRPKEILLEMRKSDFLKSFGLKEMPVASNESDDKRIARRLVSLPEQKIKNLMNGKMEFLFQMSEEYRFLEDDCHIDWNDAEVVIQESFIRAVIGWNHQGTENLEQVIRSEVKEGVCKLMIEENPSLLSVDRLDLDAYITHKKELSVRYTAAFSDPIGEYAKKLDLELVSILKVGLADRYEAKMLDTVHKYGSLYDYGYLTRLIEKNLKEDLSKGEFVSTMARLRFLVKFAGSSSRIQENINIFERPYEPLNVEGGQTLQTASPAEEDFSDSINQREAVEKILKEIGEINFIREFVGRLVFELGGRGYSPAQIRQMAMEGRAQVSLRVDEEDMPRSREMIDLSDQVVKMTEKEIIEHEERIEATIIQNLKQDIELDELSAIDLFLLTMGRGLKGLELSYTQIGDLIGVTDSRIFGIKGQVLSELRHNKSSRAISGEI